MTFARTLTLTLSLLAPWYAQATQTIDQSTIDCSESLTLLTQDNVTAQCTGNLSITGGTWTSDTLISLSATGNLSLLGVTLAAPDISLAGGQILVDAASTLTGTGHLVINGGPITLEVPTVRDVTRSPLTVGGSITLVPEPGTWALALAGLAGLMLRLRRQTC